MERASLDLNNRHSSLLSKQAATNKQKTKRPKEMANAWPGRKKSNNPAD